MTQSVLSSHGLRFRWINAQCFEFRMPNGTTLITDPFYDFPYKPGTSEANMALPFSFTTKDLEGADYIFLNHNHGDHNYNVKEVCERFHSTVITHSATAMELARVFGLPLTSIYPVDFNGIYYFDGFSLEIYHGTHHPQPKTLSDAMVIRKERDDPEGAFLRSMGGVFNMNFVQNLPGGLRIAFIGGNDDGMLERFREIRPNVVIRNKLHSSAHVENVAEEWADYLEQSDVQLMIPMHYETWLNTRPGFAEAQLEEINRIMKERGKGGRVLNPQRTKWYNLELSVTE